MNFYCIEYLGKLVDKLIAFIIFLATLDLNIFDKEKENMIQFMWDDRSI
jgi:hypothetical protein